nr:ATP-binding cassette domain-containing protein [Selenomonas ruminantium]
MEEGGMDNILEMRHITKDFSGVKALDDVNLVVKRGEIHALCGENGAGKSTLMNVLSGVYPYGTYTGDIVYNGQVQKFSDIKASEKTGIVIIHQELALIPLLTVAENIFIGNENLMYGGKVIDWEETQRKAAKVLKSIGMHENVNRKVVDLGMGQQQMIEIAKALAKNAKLLILDEPTSALNDEESNTLLELLLKLKKQGLTSIMISHKLNEVSRVADSITVIRDGHTIETIERDHGTPIDEARIIKGMVGRELTNRYPERHAQIGEVVFEVKDWTVHDEDDPTRERLSHISFNVRKGEVVGFAGLMGAGRTELAMSLFGHTYGFESQGHIYKDGQEITMPTVQSAIDQHIAYVPEDRKTYGLVLIDDIKWNMSLASLKSRFSKKGILNPDAEIHAAEDYSKRINVKADSLTQRVESLSGGNQQKVVLAKWMLSDPDVLILDEPTRGIDVGAKYEIYTVINHLAESGKAVVVISSEMEELLGLSDRIYVLNEGEIAGELQKGEFDQEAIMRIIMAHSARRETA